MSLTAHVVVLVVLVAINVLLFTALAREWRRW